MAIHKCIMVTLRSVMRAEKICINWLILQAQRLLKLNNSMSAITFTWNFFTIISRVHRDYHLKII